MVEQTVQIVSNERETDLYFRLIARAPQIAPLVQPGQFAHVRILPLREALLRRPFSIFQVSGDTLSILYKTIGKGTEVLSLMRPGEELSMIGPLGHGFTVPQPKGETPLLIAGGYGMAALYLLAQFSGPIILIQDGAKYHTSQATREFFQRHQDHLIVYQLPSYSPDYNPIEYLWKKVKTKATHNRYFAEFAKLIRSVEEALTILATQADEIKRLMGVYTKLMVEPQCA